jgi:hydrogenase/urease accessory protein HupE
MIRLLIALTLSLLSAIALAHEVRPAYLQITEAATQDGIPVYEILWKQPIVQDRRLPIDPVFPEGCELSDIVPPQVAPGALLYSWVTTCDLSDAIIHIDGLSVTLTDVMVRWTGADGEVRNYLLRPENPTLDLSEKSAATLTYLSIGIEHLVFGIDHVLFVIGLVLFIKQPVMLLKTVTAFTVAHSITLALSVLGWVTLDQGPIEAVIALSIVFLARELVLEENQRSRLTLGRPWVMASMFGLLHGLGFAGALRDIGLPEDTLWLSLLLFNVGIEIGQLIVIAALFAVGWVISRTRFVPVLVRSAAIGIGCVAMYWTIDRTLLLI